MFESRLEIKPTVNDGSTDEVRSFVEEAISVLVNFKPEVQNDIILFIKDKIKQHRQEQLKSIEAEIINFKQRGEILIKLNESL